MGIRPVCVTQADLQGWRPMASWPFKLALFWVRHGPRGKGFVPRMLGRWFGRKKRDTVQTTSGALLAVDPASLEVYATLAAGDGVWGIDVVEPACRLLKPGGVFYDIGANAGSIGIEVAKRFNDEVRIFAFEPQPSLARTIAISAELNSFKNVRVFSAMLGKEVRDAKLFLAAHSLHASAVPRENAPVIECPMTTIDQLVADGTLPPPDVIKMDVEGAEWDVFQGAAQTLKTHRPALLFESDLNAERFGYTRRKLCDYLHQLGGYRFYVAAPDRLEPIESRMDEDFDCNLLALPPGQEIDLPH